MYALIWFSRYNRSEELRLAASIEEALDEAERLQLRRAEYGERWWIAAPLARHENFFSDHGTYRVNFAHFREESEGDDADGQK